MVWLADVCNCTEIVRAPSVLGGGRSAQNEHWEVLAQVTRRSCLEQMMPAEPGEMKVDDCQ